MKYAQARADFEALEKIAELSDQVALDEEREALMKNPTKEHAASLYCAGVRLWFREHGTESLASDDETASEIKERHGIE